jgi:hypothetical protein
MHDVISRKVAAGDTDPALLASIKLCQSCARACMACADAALGGNEIARLNRCLRLSLEAADRCFEVAALSPHRAESDPYVLDRLLQSCAAACERCEAECRSHGTHHPACLICAEACRASAAACRHAMARVPAL